MADAPVQPDPGAPPNSIIAQTADGVSHVFPQGTPDDVIDSAIHAYVQQQSPGYKAAKQDFIDQQTKSAGGRGDLVGAGVELMNGMTFNNADRVEGALKAGGTYVHNLLSDDTKYSPSDAYAAARDATNDFQAQYDKAHPIAGTAMNIIGGLPIGEGAGSVISKAATIPGMITRSAGIGAGLGAAYGAGTNKDDPVQGAEIGGTIGAVTGVGAPYVAQGVRQAGGAVNQYVRGLLDPTVAAANKSAATDQKVVGYLQKQLGARAAADISNDPAVQRGAPVTVAEVLGRNAMGDVAAMARRPGEAGDLATNVLTERQYGSGDPISGTNARILDSFEDATGLHPTVAQSVQEAETEGGRKEVGPLYDAILSRPGTVYSDQLAALSKRPAIRSAAKQAYTDLLNQGKNPEDYGLYSAAAPDAPQAPALLGADGNRLTGPTGQNVAPAGSRSLTAQGTQLGPMRGQPVAAPEESTAAPDDVVFRGPTAQTWDLIKKTMGRQVDRHPVTGAVLPDSQSPMNYGISTASGDLTSALKNAIPGYDKALEESSTYLGGQAAFDRAQGMLFGNSRGKTVADTQKFFSSLKTADEEQAARRAFASDILNSVNARNFRPTTLLSPAAQQKLSIVFGDDAARKIAAAALDEQNMAKFYGRAAPGNGPITSEALMRSEEHDNGVIGDMLTHAATGAIHGGVEGAVKGTAMGLGKRAIAAFSGPSGNEDFRNRAAEYLLSPASDFATTFKPPQATTKSIVALPGIANGATQTLVSQSQRQ